MDARQERGRLLAQAQGRQIKHVEGPQWFVPSERAGGYLVDVEAATCSCPDYAEHRAKCKHLWAVEFARGANAEGGGGAQAVTGTAKILKLCPPDRPQGRRAGRTGDLTAEEQEHVRAALRFLRTRHGSLEELAKALLYKHRALENMAYGGRPSAGLAVRLARLAGAPVDDVLGGRYPPPGTCPHCGRGPEVASAELPNPPRGDRTEP